MSTPHCPVCGRWNDPSGGKESHSSGCPNTGKPYPQPRRVFPVKDYTRS